MDCLSAIYKFNSPFCDFFPWILSYTQKHTQIVDLASGNAGHLVEFLKFIERQNVKDVTVQATDLFPNVPIWINIQRKYRSSFRFSHESVNALDPVHLSCTYTIFSAFHHFNTDQVTNLIAEKVSSQSDLIVLEMTRRDTVISYIAPFLAFPFYMVSCLFSERPTFMKILLTLIIPIAPLILLFDGLVSNLRTYTKDELVGLAEQASRQSGKVICCDFIEKKQMLTRPYACRFHRVT